NGLARSHANPSKNHDNSKPSVRVGRKAIGSFRCERIARLPNGGPLAGTRRQRFAGLGEFACINFGRRRLSGLSGILPAPIFSFAFSGPEGVSEMFSSFQNAVVEFLKREDGPTAVEYAVMLALIIVVCIAAIQALGSNANQTFTSVGQAISSSS